MDAGRDVVFRVIPDFIHRLPLLPRRYNFSWYGMDPPGLLFHFDQPYRAVHDRAAAGSGSAVVWASKPVPAAQASRPLDPSHLAVRLGYRRDCLFPAEIGSESVSN